MEFFHTELEKVNEKLGNDEKGAEKEGEKDEEKEKEKGQKTEKEILEKEKKIKSKKAVPGEIEKLKSELKKKEKELEKMGEEKITEGKKAIRFLLHYNQNLVKYIVKGYSSFNRKVDHEELTAEGISSLPKAIEKFDLNSKNRFATYAGY